MTILQEDNNGVSKEAVTIEILKQIYRYFLRDFLYEKATESSTPIDDYILKTIDKLLSIKG
jgi:hypothetical protein